MSLGREVSFAVELIELAKRYGFEAVEPPFLTYGPQGIRTTGSGYPLWRVYSESGELTKEFMARFRPTPT